MGCDRDPPVGSIPMLARHPETTTIIIVFVTITTAGPERILDVLLTRSTMRMNPGNVVSWWLLLALVWRYTPSFSKIS